MNGWAIERGAHVAVANMKGSEVGLLSLRRPVVQVVLALVFGAALVAAANPDHAHAAGAVSLASHTPVGPTTAPVGVSTSPRTSANGAVVVFMSTATNLVAGQSDSNGMEDVFLFDRATGAVTLVSHIQGSATTTGNAYSGLTKPRFTYVASPPAVSADGAWVVFESNATNLLTGQSDVNNSRDVFLYSRATGALTLVSHVPGSTTTTGNGYHWVPVISANGAYVAFEADSTNLVTGQTEPIITEDVFLFERATGAITLVSHLPASSTSTGNGMSRAPSISADGGFVTFESWSTNLVTGQNDANGSAFSDVFVFSRGTGTLTLVSHIPTSSTTTANGPSDGPVISADGAFVVFSSTATNVAPSQTDTNTNRDVFLYSRGTEAVTLVSHTAAGAGTAGNGASGPSAVSADGLVVAFESSATNLAVTDGNSGADVFLFARATGAVTLVSHSSANASTTGNGSSLTASISADGSRVAFESYAQNLVAGQSDGVLTGDVFVYERASGVIELVSHTPASATTAANGLSDKAWISTDGGLVAFESKATNLVSGQSDGNGDYDAFVSPHALGSAAKPPADFDGDGDTDVSVFRPSAGLWFVQGGVTVSWGTSGDIPVPGNYDGDADTDIAVFRPSTGTWYVQGGTPIAWGTSGDIPVPGNYDGDADTDIAVFRPSTGTWYVQGGATIPWGTSGDIPVPGNYDGDADTDIAVFRPSVGMWFVQGGAPIAWGTSGDIPVPGNYDGDADTDIAVFRPSTGTWFVQGGVTVPWGTSGDIPVPGNYDGDADADIAVFRPSTGTWFVQGGATVTWGGSGDIPLPLPDAIRRSFFV